MPLDEQVVRGPNYVLSNFYIKYVSRCPGGELWTYDQGPLDIKNKWVGFDGNLPHGTLCFSGIRYSLIYFTISKVSWKSTL